MRYGMTSKTSTIVHINVTGFAASVAMARDSSLRDQVFVVAEPRAGRAVLLDVSPRALEEGLTPGMALSEVERRVRHLQVLAPDPGAMKKASDELFAAVKLFAPLVEQVPGGHLYLDLSGTDRLFGPPADTAIRIRRNIIEKLNMDPALAVAPNKLTAKVATRTLRPIRNRSTIAPRPPPTIKRELRFQGAVSDREVLRGALMALAEEAGMSLRQQRLTARSLGLSLHYADGIQHGAKKSGGNKTGGL